jgi:hypothetical protein
MKLSLISLGRGLMVRLDLVQPFSINITNSCQLCHSEEHTASTCPKLADTRPKCAKCGGVHKTDNCGLKCSFCFGLGHMKERCWKNFAKGLPVTTNFLEVLVDDEKVTLAKLNHVCGKDQHIVSRVRIPKKRLPITTNPAKEQEEVIMEDGQRRANLGSKVVVKFKILSFHQRKDFLNSHGNHSYNSKRTAIFGRASKIS